MESEIEASTIRGLARSLGINSEGLIAGSNYQEGLSLLKYADTPPPTSVEFSNGVFRAAPIEPPIVARELLKIPGSEYIVREVSGHLALFQVANPERADAYDWSTIWYTLGQPEVDLDTRYITVPFKLYALPKRV